jgi:hypothetical protein
MAKFKKQYSLEQIRKHHLSILQGEQTAKREYCDPEVYEDWIESWYEWDTFNPYLVMGDLDKDQSERKLKELRSLKPTRRAFYTDPNRPILGLLCEYPDVVDAKQIDPKRSSPKLILERDHRSSDWAEVFRLYDKAKDDIEGYIHRQNKKLRKKNIFFTIKPITITFDSHIESFYIKPASSASIINVGIKRFLHELSAILYPSLPTDHSRASKICDILKIFYGIPSHLASPDNIRKHIAKEIY